MKGKGKGKPYHANALEDFYFQNKGKGKGKSKKGMFLEAQAQWYKGKGKSKSLGPPRPVNAYASDMYLGGLEMSNTMDLAAVASSPTRPELGMVDCGATASAAPDAVVKGLISSILECDKGARIDIDQSARPYFRFGNGRWGRALYRVHLSSDVSGSWRKFSLFALPNPSEFYEANFDKTSLVPVLVGMDFLGQQGAGMLLDFTTGLSMFTSEGTDEVLQLVKNRKGHFMLDILKFLTRDHRRADGHAHVVVSPKGPVDNETSDAHVLEFHVLQYDMTASDESLQPEVPDGHVLDLSLATSELELSRLRLLRLRQLSQELPLRPAAVATAQMCGAPPLAPSHPSPTSSPTSLLDGGLCPSALRPRALSREGCSDGHSGQDCGQAEGTGTGPYSHHEGGPPRSQGQQEGLALLRTSCSGESAVQPTRAMGSLRNVRPTDHVHSSGRLLCSAHDLQQSGDDCTRSQGAGTHDGQLSADRCNRQGHAGQGQRGGDPPEPDPAPSGEPAGYYDSHSEDYCSNHEPRGSLNGKLAGDIGHGGHGSSGGLRARGHRAALNEQQYDAKEMLKPLTQRLCGRVMSFAALMATATATSLMGLHLEDRDGLWEVACAPHSWLSEAASELGLQPRRINLSSGYDLYQAETWRQLRELRKKCRPRRLWFSLPCTKWCPWTAVNYNTPELKEKLETYRRRERRLMWFATNFIRESLAEDEDLLFYWEWPKRCSAWMQKPMLKFADFLSEQFVPWLGCRIDGCRYGMRDMQEQRFIQKEWIIKTNDEKFHHAFRAKVCPGNHEHTRIEGVETSRTSYYPWKMVQSICRHWRDQHVPVRHLRLATSVMDVPVPLDVGDLLPAEDVHAGLPSPHDSALPVLRQPGHLPSAMTSESPTTTVPPGSEDSVSDNERQLWEAKIAKFHKSAGHPSNSNLARILREAGHPEWRVQLAKNHQCPACLSLKPGGTSSGQIPPVTTSELYHAWQAVGVDTSEWVVPGRKTKVKFFLFADMATKLRVLVPIKTYEVMEMQAETTDDVIRAFSEKWLGQYPKPEILILDAAKTFTSEKFHEFASQANIQLHVVAEKAAWANGVIESMIQDVKMTASAIQLEALDQDPFVTLYLTASALNATEFTAGYTAHQWCFGKTYSLSDEDIRTYEQIPSDRQTDFIKLVNSRARAEEVARRTRAQRVVSKLGNTTVRQPLREYHPMDLVKVWRKLWPAEVYKGPRGGLKRAGRPHWVGPGRVIFHEVLPHQGRDDDRRHIVWVLVGTQLLRCSVHAVRPATEVEKFHYHVNNQEDFTRWKTLKDILPRREYVDLTDQEPGDDEVEQPPLPLQPDGSTVRAPSRRVTRKTTFAQGDYVNRPVNERLRVEESVNEYQEAPPSTSAASSSRPPPAPDELPEQKRARTLDGNHTLASLGPSWVDELYMEAEQESEVMDIHTAMEETNDFLKIEFDLESPCSKRQQKLLDRNPVAYMVKKMRDSEVVLTKLTPSERLLFSRAKTKEVSSFLKNEAVRKCLDDSEIREAFDTNRIIKARWVLTWKLIPPEDREEAVQDAFQNPETVHDSQGRRKAKARIVLLGFQHPSLLDPTFKTAAPVQSTIGRHLLYVMSTHHQWSLEGLDLATAFLQTELTEADARIWTTGVEELRQALNVGSEGIMRILKNVYGSTTAPRGLWLSLHKKLTSLGAKPALGERCLWIWSSSTEKEADGSPVTIGAMGGHVDDFHRIGNQDCSEWQEVREKINGAYQWGTVKSGSYRHAGTDVSTVYGSNGKFKIIVDQEYYIESLTDVEIPPDRLRCDGPLRPGEVAACRTALGGLQWLAIQTQPQLCARCNLLLTEVVTDGSLCTAREIQGMVAEIRQQSYKLHFFPMEDAKHWSDLVFVSMGDQAHNNRPKGDSTGGMLTLVSGPGCSSGRISPMSLIAWRTWKLRRKAIGSNDAEVQSILEAEDQNFRVRMLWAELHGAGTARQLRDNLVEKQEELARRVKGILCTDSRGGYDAVELNESPLLGLSNMRAALQAFALRENLSRVGCELRWVASDYDLADALTKKKQDARCGLQKFLTSWLWAISFDPTFTSAKKSKRQGRSAVGRIDDHLKGTS